MPVAQLTRWYLEGSRRKPMIRKRSVYVLFPNDEDDWSDGGDFPTFELLPTRGGVEFMSRVARRRPGGLTNIVWQFYPDEDERIFIDEADWPDEVCTALAKLALGVGGDEES